MQPIKGFCGGAFEAQDSVIDAQRCINIMPINVESDTAKGNPVLVRTPGLSDGGLGDINTFENLRQSKNQPLVYTASNGNIYTFTNRLTLGQNSLSCSVTMVTTDGDIFYLGATVTIYPGQAGISDNGIVILLSVGSNYYVIDLAGRTNLTVVVLSDAYLTVGSSHIAFMDGYFIVNINNSTIFRHSPLNWNGLTAWAALAFGEANQSPGFIRGLIVSGRDLIIFSVGSYEVWYDAGTTPMAFARNISVAYNMGLQAKSSLAQLRSQVFWVGSGVEGYGQIFTLNGYQPVRISTSAIEAQMSAFITIDDGIGFTYQQAGQYFYVITFPSGDRTFVYNLTSNLWHERAGWDTTTARFTRWRVNAVALFNNRLICADETEAVVFKQLDLFAYDDYGDVLRWLRSSPHMHNGMQRLAFLEFKLDINSGAGIISGQGVDPVIFLRWSSDNADTWSNLHQKKMGKMGKYLKQVVWNRLGSGYDRVWEISGSDPVRIAIAGAYINAESEG